LYGQRIGQNNGDGMIPSEPKEVFERKEELSAACRACQAFINKFRKDIVMKNQTRLDVVNEMKNMCQYLPVKKERCAQLAENATPVLMDIYIKALELQMPCLGMKICPEKSLNLTISSGEVFIPWLKRLVIGNNDYIGNLG
jgi:hypothetical protein